MINPNICKNEDQIIFENNNPQKETTNTCYTLDPINIYDIKGRHIGYSWNYGDSVELQIDLNKTVLHVTEDRLELLKMYVSDKEFEFNFTDIRGEAKYTFYSKPEDLIVKLKLNDSEESLIEKNTYKLSVVLVNPLDLSRINILWKPYNVYVK